MKNITPSNASNNSRPHYAKEKFSYLTSFLMTLARSRMACASALSSSSTSDSYSLFASASAWSRSRLIPIDRDGQTGKGGKGGGRGGARGKKGVFWLWAKKQKLDPRSVVSRGRRQKCDKDARRGRVETDSCRCPHEREGAAALLGTTEDKEGQPESPDAAQKHRPKHKQTFSENRNTKHAAA